MKRVLMVAFHFPPMTGSSGIQRALKYCQYLPEFGWHPLVLTSHPRAYLRTSEDLLAGIPSDVVVKRAFALDSARHLAVAGRYPGWLSIPDRWVSWLAGAIPAGLALIRRHRPDVIWSTFPIATAHLIGLYLQRFSGLPWVADFRDPMAQDGYPPDPRRWRAYRWIEEQALTHAQRSLFTTPGTLRMYAERYPQVPHHRLVLNENGYDEETFAAALPADARPTVPGRRARLKLLHSGVIYPSERDPTALFEALSDLIDAGRIAPATLEIVLRATGHDPHLAPMISRYGLEGLVSLAPPVGYREALAEMMDADGLLVLQAANCNDQVPAKVYEYFRAGRPILGLTDLRGDTATVMRAAGVDTIAPLDSREAIRELLPRFLDQLRAGSAPVPTQAAVHSSSRRARARELAGVLEGVIGSTPQV